MSGPQEGPGIGLSIWDTVRGIDAAALPETERCAGRILSLPVYPELTEEQRMQVVTSLLEATASKAMEEQRV